MTLDELIINIKDFKERTKEGMSFEQTIQRTMFQVECAKFNINYDEV
jgi:hypothetical protein